MAGVTFTVMDKSGNPIPGAEVTVVQPGSPPVTYTGQTNSKGQQSFATSSGGGQLFTYTIAATGWQEAQGTIGQPFWPWQYNNKSVALVPQPVGGLGGLCPPGYTYNSQTGQCDANAGANWWTGFSDTVKSFITEITIVAFAIAIVATIAKVKKR